MLIQFFFWFTGWWLGKHQNEGCKWIVLIIQINKRWVYCTEIYNRYTKIPWSCCREPCLWWWAVLMHCPRLLSRRQCLWRIWLINSWPKQYVYIQDSSTVEDFNKRGLRLLNSRGLLNSWGLFSNRGSLQNLNSIHEIWNGGYMYLTAITSRCFESFITEISHVKTNFWLCIYWIITAKILHFDCYFSVKWELIFSF